MPTQTITHESWCGELGSRWHDGGMKREAIFFLVGDSR